jgi:hypothetical protein
LTEQDLAAARPLLRQARRFLNAINNAGLLSLSNHIEGAPTAGLELRVAHGVDEILSLTQKHRLAA